MPSGRLTMNEQFCIAKLGDFVQLVNFQKAFMLVFCLLNFVFSLVATLGNILLIRALVKASSIPIIVKKLFLNLAISDLAVGLLVQLMAGIISAVMLNMASKGDYNLTPFCPVVLNVYSYVLFLLGTASFLTVTTIAVDRLLAISLHLRYQELITPKRVTILLISLWLISCITAFIYILLPESNEMSAAVISLIGYVLTTVAYVRIYKVVKYHQNQIYSQNQLQVEQKREEIRQKKSAYNALFVYLVFLACYLPFLPSTILYLTNTSEISFLVVQGVSVFLICLNSSLNPLLYCWRYREIRENVKNTVKKLFSMDENMT